MKIRVTIMTENDVHSPNPIPEIEAAATSGWTMLLSALTGGASRDKAYVEKVEVIEN